MTAYTPDSEKLRSYLRKLEVDPLLALDTIEFLASLGEPENLRNPSRLINNATRWVQELMLLEEWIYYSLENNAHRIHSVSSPEAMALDHDFVRLCNVEGSDIVRSSSYPLILDSQFQPGSRIVALKMASDKLCFGIQIGLTRLAGDHPDRCHLASRVLRSCANALEAATAMATRNPVPAQPNAPVSRDFLHPAFDQAPDGMLLIDEQGAILEINAAALRYLRQPKESVRGRNMAVLLPDSVRPFLGEQLNLAKNNGVCRGEMEWPMADAEPVHLDCMALAIETERRTMGRFYAFYLRDITAAKRVNGAIAAAKTVWERTFDSVQDYLFIVDANSTIKRVNMPLAAAFGVHPREMVGRPCETFFDFCLPSSSHDKDFFQHSTGPDQQRDVYSYSLGGYFQVNVYPLFNLDPEHQGVIYIARDITQQKQLEIQLREAHHQLEQQFKHRTEELRRVNQSLLAHIRAREATQKQLLRFNAIVDQVADSIVLTRTDWGIEYLNPAFQRISGISPEEAATRKTSLLDYLDQPGTSRPNIEAEIQAKGIWTGHLSKVRPDGSSASLRAQIGPLRDQQGEIVNYISVLRDVSQEEHMELRIRNSEKMEAIGIFAGGIAHDFNNILSGIIGSIELAEDELPEESPAWEDLRQARLYAENAKKMVSQILNFKSQDALHVCPLSALNVFQEAIPLCRGLLPDNVHLDAQLASTEWMILANPIHIQQVLNNLVSNAAHAMDVSGGIVRVGLSEVVIENPDGMSMHPLPPGEYLWLVVEDTGCGISREILAKIYDPLFSTRRENGGFGMGLAVVHAIVQRLGGALRVFSEVGTGTRFEIFIPRCRPEDVHQLY